MAEAFVLDAKPTFKATVSIPLAGDDVAPGKLTFTFKHYPLSEYQAWLKQHQAELDACESDVDGFPLMVQGIMHIAEGWALPDEFNAENIHKLLNNYGRAYAAITATYFADLMGIRAKN